MNEIFRPIKKYENYRIGNFGNVMNVNTGRILKSCISTTGYKHVNLSQNSKIKLLTIHRLVALAFIPNLENKPHIDHINNDKLNNNVNNLRWASYSENSQNRSMRKDNTSGIKGIYFKKQLNKWCAQIKLNGKNKNLGYFESKEDAIKVRLEASNKQFGEFQNKCEKELNINLNVPPNVKINLNINVVDEKKELEDLEAE
jgi:hypothetical protein